MPQLTETAAWQALEQHAKAIGTRHLRDFFSADANRFDKLSLQHGELLVDFSKQRVTPETMERLHSLARQADVSGWAEKMRNGEKINHTEQRAVLHTTLRAGPDAPDDVKAVLARMEKFCEEIHGGTWRGFSGERITDVVNIGIGGSDLGPRMVAHALSSVGQPDIRVSFVTNLDGADIATTLSRLNPRTTLFIVASKTFTTHETLRNAHTARGWLLSATSDERAIARHFIAASSNLDAAEAFGIPATNVFQFSDGVGGRFSLWSSIGLSIALSIGFRNFEQLLAGALDMDTHFFGSPAERNLPLTLALLALWNTNFLKAHSLGIFPYSQSLALLPFHLQQLEMESNGKHVDRQGQPVDIATAPILWGAAGTNGQHSFFQLLHQGSELVACEFIALGKSDFPLPGHHHAQLANCLAQSSALAFGQTQEEAREAGIPEALLPYRTFPGNQPSTTIVLSELTPHSLGQLIALYEHKVFCLGILWNLNSFDQWGVELGKQLANRLVPCLTENAPTDALDGSTRGLIAHLRKFRS